MKVTDAFEIKTAYQTGHAAGLVVVLDAPLGADPASLVGRTAAVRTPAGTLRTLRIDGAKRHGPADSLFFQGLAAADVPLDSDVTIAEERQPEPNGAAPSPAASPVSGGLTR